MEIARGQLVVIDWGAELDGYCSDCTRTVAAGEPGEHAREMYELVLRAQQAGLAAVHAGAVCREVDAAARDVIDAAGHGEHFGHGLGHGVGLEIHEAPTLSQSYDGTLEDGNVVTVEPGVYLPGGSGCGSRISWSCAAGARRSSPRSPSSCASSADRRRRRPASYRYPQRP